MLKSEHDNSFKPKKKKKITIFKAAGCKSCSKQCLTFLAIKQRHVGLLCECPYRGFISGKRHRLFYLLGYGWIDLTLFADKILVSVYGFQITDNQLTAPLVSTKIILM